MTTNLAACAGACMALFTSWIKFGKPDIGMTLNGTLAGLVAITAGCANVSPGSALIIGGIGGVLVVFAVVFIDRIKIDDPVGAVSVHMVNGVWGTLAAGLFNMTGTSLHMVGVQLLGIFACLFGPFPWPMDCSSCSRKLLACVSLPRRSWRGSTWPSMAAWLTPISPSSYGGITSVPSEPQAPRMGVVAPLPVRQA